MSDTAKDPAIKLFGRRIAFPDDQTTGTVEDGSDLVAVDHSSELAEKDGCIEAASDASKDHSNFEGLDRNNANDTSDLKDVNDVEIQASCLDDKEITDSKTEQEHVDVDVSSQEKVLLKKPDKILPCPRCSSMDTKFCYYNNYNVNQPRHFCRKCQRYWTAGGTMRNVPVGAGRRKNKHSSSQFRQLTISSDGLSSPRVQNHCSNDSQLHSTPTNPYNGNGRTFKVSQDAPFIPTTDVLITERKGKAEVNHVARGENINEPSCLSSTTTSNCMRKENSENTAQLDQAVLAGTPNSLTHVNPLQCYPVPTWAYPWNAGWGNITGISSGQCTPDMVYVQESGGPKLVPWSPPTMLAAPAFCAPNMPYPFLPASFWGCMPPWTNGTCNSPRPGVNGILSASLSTSNSRFSGSNSPTLGKHSREAGSHAAEKKEKSLWVPKTLRIDDPDEAARSSIWATLGIKCDQNEPVAKGRIFKSFQPRTETEDQNNDTTQVLHANPAALSRSNTFKERT